MARQAKPRLLTHEQVWTALDRLAARAGLSASGLARRAGLDPTTFNKSKRVTPDGRERWPSTESVAKALAAADASIETFVQLTGDGARQAVSVPLLGLAQAGQRGQFDEHGHLAGKDFDEIALPSLDGEHAFALEISGHAHEPAYRDGDVLLVSPVGRDPPRRPRGGEDRRGSGDWGAEATHREDAGTRGARSRAGRPRDRGRRCGMDRADYLGAAVAESSLPGLTRQSIKKSLCEDDGCAGRARA